MTGKKGVRAPALNVHISTLPVGASAYSNDNCRCGGCRSAWADYNLDLRRGRAERRDLHPVPHGTAGGYTNYHCRCDECRDAHSTRMRNFRAAQPRPTRPVVDDAGGGSA